MIHLDTDILIWILRGDAHLINQFKRRIVEFNAEFYLTPIQIAEIYHGLKEKERSHTELFLNSFKILPIDNKTGILAGVFLNKYAKSHNVLISDAFIAAATIINNLRLWTKNIKHYPMLDKKDLL